MPTKVFVKNYGCQMNQYDAMQISTILQDKYKISATDDYTEAAFWCLIHAQLGKKRERFFQS